MRPELEVSVCHLGVVEFVETYGIARVRSAEKVELGCSWGVLMEVGIGAGGSGTSNEGSVMVSWQEPGKLEIRPKMGGQGLKLGGTRARGGG